MDPSHPASQPQESANGGKLPKATAQRNANHFRPYHYPPQANDVLLSKPLAEEWPANKTFTKLIRCRKDSLKRGDRRAIDLAMEIVELIEERTGRFFIYENGEWVHLGNDEIVVEKVMDALKDAANKKHYQEPVLTLSLPDLKGLENELPPSLLTHRARMATVTPQPPSPGSQVARLDGSDPAPPPLPPLPAFFREPDSKRKSSAIDRKAHVKKAANKRPKTTKASSLSKSVLRKLAQNKGVSQRASGNWQAQIYFYGHSRYMGIYSNMRVAAAAYLSAEKYLEKHRNIKYTDDEATKIYIEVRDKIKEEFTDPFIVSQLTQDADSGERSPRDGQGGSDDADSDGQPPQLSHALMGHSDLGSSSKTTTAEDDTSTHGISRLPDGSWQVNVLVAGLTLPLDTYESRKAASIALRVGSSFIDELGPCKAKDRDARITLARKVAKAAVENAMRQEQKSLRRQPKALARAQPQSGFPTPSTGAVPRASTKQPPGFSVTVAPPAGSGPAPAPSSYWQWYPPHAPQHPPASAAPPAASAAPRQSEATPASHPPPYWSWYPPAPGTANGHPPAPHAQSVPVSETPAPSPAIAVPAASAWGPPPPDQPAVDSAAAPSKPAPAVEAASYAPPPRPPKEAPPTGIPGTGPYPPSSAPQHYPPPPYYPPPPPYGYWPSYYYPGHPGQPAPPPPAAPAERAEEEVTRQVDEAVASAVNAAESISGPPGP